MALVYRKIVFILGCNVLFILYRVRSGFMFRVAACLLVVGIIMI